MFYQHFWQPPSSTSRKKRSSAKFNWLGGYGFKFPHLNVEWLSRGLIYSRGGRRQTGKLQSVQHRKRFRILVFSPLESLPYRERGKMLTPGLPGYDPAQEFLLTKWVHIQPNAIFLLLEQHVILFHIFLCQVTFFHLCLWFKMILVIVHRLTPGHNILKIILSVQS